MARPHPSAKPTVDLASSLTSPGPRVSRIRRDPPPAVKKEVVVDVEEREQWAVILGVGTFALAIFVIVIAFGIYFGWSPAQYTLEV